MYGIPHSRDYKDYDACARAVSDVLNSVEGPRRWMPDIARAHRVGHSRNGEPKPTIVKFIKRKDKTAILRNRKYRDDLEKNGVRVANDLTKNQASVLTEAKKGGKVAYFRKGKPMVGPTLRASLSGTFLKEHWSFSNDIIAVKGIKCCGSR